MVILGQQQHFRALAFGGHRPFFDPQFIGAMRDWRRPDMQHQLSLKMPGIHQHGKFCQDLIQL